MLWHHHLLFGASLLVGTFISAGVSPAQTDVLDIEGPKEVAPGDLVRLVAAIEKDESPFWIVLKPDDLNYEQVDGGRRLIFAVGCKSRGPIIVMLLAQQVKDGRILTRQVQQQIRIVNQAPETPDKPNPPPTPEEDPTVDPDVPENDPLFAGVQAAASKITDPNARSKSADVAANFQLVSRRCLSGEIGDIPAISLTLSELNRRALGVYQRQWEPVAVAIQQEFKRLKLKSVAEHARPLSIAAAALRKGARRE